jgi:uncharacterized delta-60 repeat protein
MERHVKIALAATLTLVSGISSGAEGELDTTFNGTGRQTVAFGGPSFGLGAALTTAGAVYVVGGTSAGADAPLRISIARLLADGEYDDTFNADGDSDGRIVYDIYPSESVANTSALQSDGKLVVAGVADVDESPGLDYRMIVCRILPNGEADATFGQIETPGCRAIDSGLADAGLGTASALHIQSDGRIVVAGTVTVAGVGKAVVARLLPTGEMDADGFGEQGVTILSPDKQGSILVSDIEANSLGQLIVGGTLALGPDDSDFVLFRVQPDGAQDMSFNEGLLTIAFDIGGPAARQDVANALKVLDDDSILVAGSAEFAPNQRQMAVAKVDKEGVLDLDFNGTGKLSPFFCGVCVDAVANSMALQSDGTIILAGTVETNGASDFGVISVGENGIIDNGFGTDGRAFVGFDLDAGDPDDSANAVILQNGRIMLVGTANAPADDGRVFAVARLETDVIFADDFDIQSPNP